MGEESKAKQIFWDTTLHKVNPYGEEQDQWVVAMEGGGDDDVCESTVSAESSMEDSLTNSDESLSSTDLLEDASSSPLSHANGPLYELSQLMSQLPIKRGLSKYYQGKSQSYNSLASVKSLEDLAKKVSTTTPYRSKMKSCKSYGGALNGHKSYSPKATISKKASRGSFLSSLGKRGSIVGDS